MTPVIHPSTNKPDSAPDLVFQLASLRFVIRPVDKLGLPPYKGATLRGGFGYAFKDLVCIKPDRHCPNCLIQDHCSYYQIFETPVPKGAQMMRKYNHAPHPFVLTPPLDERTEFTADDELTFELVLIGQAIDYLPYFIYVFDDLGRRGIGRNRDKFTLLRVEAYVPEPSASPRLCVESSLEFQTIYNGSTKTLTDFTPLSFADIHQSSFLIRNSIKGPSLTLNFLTPVRIQTEGQLDHELSFTNLMKALLRRIQLLQYFHCLSSWQHYTYIRDHGEHVGETGPNGDGGSTRADGIFALTEIHELLNLSESVKTVDSRLTFRDQSRFSTRQNRSTPISGFTGAVTFGFHSIELLTSFLPFLRLGEFTHIGKNTAFGLGKYGIVDPSQN